MLYMTWNSHTRYMNCVSGNVQRLPPGSRRSELLCFSVADMILHQLWSAGADCSVQRWGRFLPLWTSVPLLGKSATMAGWLQSKNRPPFVPPAVSRHFSPQSPSLSLASSVKCKQEAVKYPPWPGRGSHTASGDRTLLWSAGQPGGSSTESEKLCHGCGLLCWTLFVDGCQKQCDLAWERNFAPVLQLLKCH